MLFDTCFRISLMVTEGGCEFHAVLLSPESARSQALICSHLLKVSSFCCAIPSRNLEISTHPPLPRHRHTPIMCLSPHPPLKGNVNSFPLLRRFLTHISHLSFRHLQSLAQFTHLRPEVCIWLTGGQHLVLRWASLIASWIYMHILNYICIKSNFKTIKANRSPKRSWENRISARSTREGRVWHSYYFWHHNNQNNQLFCQQV